MLMDCVSGHIHYGTPQVKGLIMEVQFPIPTHWEHPSKKDSNHCSLQPQTSATSLRKESRILYGRQHSMLQRYPGSGKLMSVLYRLSAGDHPLMTLKQFQFQPPSHFQLPITFFLDQLIPYSLLACATF